MPDAYAGRGAKIPLRAIPWATVRAITPRLVAVAAGQDPEWEGRALSSCLDIYHFDERGSPARMAWAESSDWAMRVDELHAQGATLTEQVRAIPPNIFAYERDIVDGPLAEITELRAALPPWGLGRTEPAFLTTTPYLAEDVRNFIAGQFTLSNGVEIAGKAPRRKPSARDEDRLHVRDLARTIWQDAPQLNQTHLLRRSEFAPYVRKYKDRKTLPGWIRDLDPHQGEKRGRPKKSLQ